MSEQTQRPLHPETGGSRPRPLRGYEVPLVHKYITEVDFAASDTAAQFELMRQLVAGETQPLLNTLPTIGRVGTSGMQTEPQVGMAPGQAAPLDPDTTRQWIDAIHGGTAENV